MTIFSTLLMILLILTAIFLIILILIQRGKGGGLAGAFGGMGGQSAFGTKAGDLFTKITIGVAFVWILLCIVSVKMLGSAPEVIDPNLGGANVPVQGPATPGAAENQPGPASAEKQPAPGTEQPDPETPPSQTK
jgi:preprotein translocase subunit SecG